jgi:hypothetical protein
MDEGLITENQERLKELRSELAERRSEIEEAAPDRIEKLWEWFPDRLSLTVEHLLRDIAHYEPRYVEGTADVNEYLRRGIIADVDVLRARQLPTKKQIGKSRGGRPIRWTSTRLRDVTVKAIAQFRRKYHGRTPTLNDIAKIVGPKYFSEEQLKTGKLSGNTLGVLLIRHRLDWKQLKK